ncbi:neurotrophin receptor-interacting factor homolog isoform X2 [Neoarius graeffei]|uniref:neurotrophin receptor-interacting factor homolog isoform X2 n=1 Tax=Neoarius graeffei TaxID=443677 RepID=UPI00298D035B|nr:neurotrophin receptor-interacting factor homolog isoform X2 [Neoarius graeffei]
MEPSQLTEIITCLQEDQQQRKQCLETLMQIQAQTQSFMQQESKDPKKAVLQWSEHHRQRFRSLTLSDVGHPFAFAQQLQDNCQKWLLAEDQDARRIVERVVMEQLVERLPEVTAKWVQHQQPATLNEAIQLAENHMASLSPLFSIYPSEAMMKARWVKWSEQHHQKFRSLLLSDVGNLFAFAQQLQDNCEKWLLAEDRDPGRIVERVVMEQFIAQLPEVIAKWVQHQQPATLNEAIQLAVNQSFIVVCVNF